jgi:hypothetical protein
MNDHIQHEAKTSVLEYNSSFKSQYLLLFGNTKYKRNIQDLNKNGV